MAHSLSFSLYVCLSNKNEFFFFKALNVPSFQILFLLLPLPATDGLLSGSSDIEGKMGLYKPAASGMLCGIDFPIKIKLTAVNILMLLKFLTCNHSVLAFCPLITLHTDQCMLIFVCSCKETSVRP